MQMNFHNWRIRIPHNLVPWFRVSVVLLWLVLIAFLEGCGGPPRQVLIPPTMAQMQLPNANKDLQQQLMLQGGRTSPADYKDYQVGPEDQLGIKSLARKNCGEVRVNGQGEIRVHLLGDVPVAGLTPLK